VLLLAPPTARLVVVALGRGAAGIPGVRPALAAGTMLGVLVCFAPAAYVLAVAGALLGWVGVGLARWALRTSVLILGVAAVFLVLWATRLVGAPWLGLAEVGVNDPSLGAPQLTVWGLAPGGPTSVWWAGAPLLAVAGIALVLDRFSTRAVALAAGAGALLAVAGWLQPVAGAWWPDLAVGMLWPGVPLMLAGGALVLLVAVSGRPGRSAGIVTAGLAISLGALMAAWWVAPVTTTVATGGGIPPVVALDAESRAPGHWS
jgi:hypothetical protein